jgi:uncharacterized LabA/DUF88 family protein
VGKAYVLVDGGYVRERLKEIGADWQKVDLYALGHWAIRFIGDSWSGDGLALARVFVYDAASPGGDEEVWLEANNRTADVTVQYGKLSRGKRRQQKAVDVQLAVDAVRFAHNKVCDCICLIAGDSDFIPVIEAIKDAGPLSAISVWRSSYASDLAAVADRVGYFHSDPGFYTIRTPLPENPP